MQVLHFNMRIFLTCSACLFVDEELEVTYKHCYSVAVTNGLHHPSSILRVRNSRFPFLMRAQCIVDPVVKLQLHFISLLDILEVHKMNSSTAFDQPSSLSAAEPGPSFFNNSCTGQGMLFSEHKQKEGGFSSISKSSREGLGPAPNLCIDTSEETSWTIDLKDIPTFTEQNLNRKLISNAETMPDNIAPKAHRHKMEGYKLWKAGYVSNTKVKPNVSAGGFKLFIVKSSVSASIKSIRYAVYVHLNMDSSDVTHAKCNCKAGQGGCCKHVAAVLYTILDFSNLKLRYVP